MVKIHKITANYHQWQQYGSSGERYWTYEVGVNGVTKIKREPPKSQMDRLSFLVFYEGGTVIEIFNPDRVWAVEVQRPEKPKTIFK